MIESVRRIAHKGDPELQALTSTALVSNGLGPRDKYVEERQTYWHGILRPLGPCSIQVLAANSRGHYSKINSSISIQTVRPKTIFSGSCLLTSEGAANQNC